MALDGVVAGGRDGVLDGKVSQKDMSVSQNMQCLTFRGFRDITFCVVSRKNTLWYVQTDLSLRHCIVCGQSCQVYK